MAFVNEELYLSVIGYGILIIKNNKITCRLSTHEGMLSNHCTRLFVHNKEVYVCSNKGLNKIVKNDHQRYSVTQLNSFLFNGSQQVNDVYVDQNRIYIASLNGIHVLKKSTSFSTTRIEPKVYLTEIKYGGKTHTKDEHLKLSYGDRHIVFKFAAPSYYYPEGIRYEYKINAGPWLDLAIPQLELNAMVPGSYELQIRARHNESQWSRPIQYLFTVERPFYLSWWFYTLLGLGVIGWLYFNYLQKIKKLQKEQKTRLEYEQEINRLQLKSLQAMINPHFVFNSLSAIQQEINAGDAKKANNYLTRFSRLLRKNLENLNESFITLDEEVSMLTLYLDTEKMRLDDQLDYEIRVQPGMDPHNTWLPTMLLQPIVENAIWHGIAASGVSGKVLIQFDMINDRLHITIEDNGLGIEKSRAQKNLQLLKGKALGMSITQDRLIFLERKIGSPITFDVVDKKHEGSKGTRVVITMSGDL
ncbi:MAG: histidine kinase [Saprospiraceae bacterium]|nr:histidine kinase [Saprospiraceae bacterium]